MIPVTCLIYRLAGWGWGGAGEGQASDQYFAQVHRLHDVASSQETQMLFKLPVAGTRD
jgi:hypothetical protein